MKTILLFLSLIIISSCKYDKHKSFNKTYIKDFDTLNTHTEKTEKQTVNNNIDSLELLIRKISKVKIIAFEKGFMQSSLPDSLICTDWILKKEDFFKLIKRTKKMDSDDLHYLFETQTCIYKGRFLLEGREYTFGINSGGWLHLEYGDIVMGCFDKKCESYFLGKVDNPSKEFIKN